MDIVFSYKKSKGKSLRVAAFPYRYVEVRVPKRMSILIAKAFILAKKGLIENLVQRQEKKLLQLKSEFDSRLFEVHSKQKLAEYKKEALLFVQEEISKTAKKEDFPYKKIQIKNTTSRWGSCSSKGTLSFHYRILFLPEELQRYLLIHELSHLKEMNHSARFWAAVKEGYPEYEEAKKKLKSIPIFS